MAAAEWSPSRELFELLLAYHADPNIQDNNGRTPLQRVIQVNKPEIAELLRQHGALDNPPQWDVIIVNRLSGHEARVVYSKGINDWNHFTLLETVLNYYVSGEHVVQRSEFQIVTPTAVLYRPSPIYLGNTMPFPDLSRILIVRPGHDSTNESRTKEL